MAVAFVDTGSDEDRQRITAELSSNGTPMISHGMLEMKLETASNGKALTANGVRTYLLMIQLALPSYANVPLRIGLCVKWIKQIDYGRWNENNSWNNILQVQIELSVDNLENNTNPEDIYLFELDNDSVDWGAPTNLQVSVWIL